MTEVKFFRREGKLLGFSSQGHSGYAEEGSDIVCAAISAVTQTSAILADEILKIPNAVTVDGEQALISVTCDGGKAWYSNLAAAELFLSELAKQYPKYLTVEITEV